jgi:lipid II:glycine glycyltransferase (peptidoglycan interpeptide bridge formation enzyme)
MTPEERIKRLEMALDHVQNENRRLKMASGSSKYLIGIPIDPDYVTYLRRAVMRLETMVDERQEIIEQYQAHYAKYGHVYKEYEDKVHPQRHPLDMPL